VRVDGARVAVGAVRVEELDRALGPEAQRDGRGAEAEELVALGRVRAGLVAEALRPRVHVGALEVRERGLNEARREEAVTQGIPVVASAPVVGQSGDERAVVRPLGAEPFEEHQVVEAHVIEAEAHGRVDVGEHLVERLPR
jgi:hypothetical protein